MLQDLGFLAFTLPEVEILMPTKKPRGAELTLEQQLAVASSKTGSVCGRRAFAIW